MIGKDFIRLASNYYISKKLDVDIARLNTDIEVWNYIQEHQADLQKKYKVALVFICLNPLYWQYAPEMVKGAKELFLPGHQTDFFFWTDIPEKEKIPEKYKAEFQKHGVDVNNPVMVQQDILINNTYQFNIQKVIDSLVELRNIEGINIIPVDPVDWPYPTLLRYNLFLQQEEKLKDYDYIFYLDCDMQFCNVVGDEILPKEGLMATVHPGYHIRQELYPPYEPNSKSASYIKRPGRIIEDSQAKNAKNELIGKRFQPLYYAGGFQGGRAKPFIQAMKDTRLLIEQDLTNRYIPIWNDESAWNKYLSENPPEIVLNPSYIYPDSLIKEYYIPVVWGRDYQPKIKTLTKWFSTSKEGGKAVQQMTQQLK